MRRFLFLEKALAVSAILLSFLYLPVSATSSDSHIALFPATQKLELISGETQTNAFIVKNKGAENLSLSIYATPYQVKNESYEADFSKENASTLISKWIKLSQSHLVLEPGEEKTIEYSVTVPSETAAGGQYAAIMVEARPDYSDDVVVKAVGRIGMIIYGHVQGDIRQGGYLVSSRISSFETDGAIKTSVDVENTGNIDFDVSTTLKVQDFFSGKIIYANLDNPDTFTVLPDTNRIINQSWRDSPLLGLFKVEQSVTLFDQTDTTNGIALLMPPWLLVAIIVFITSSILIAIRLIKSNQKKYKKLRYE